MSIPDGEERLATQAERDELNLKMAEFRLAITSVTLASPFTVWREPAAQEINTMTFQTDSVPNTPGDNNNSPRSELATFRDISTTSHASTINRRGLDNSQIQRDMSNGVNRFLLCAVSSASAKRIKARAEKMGESLSMTMVVRAFLRSYRGAEQDGSVVLTESNPDSDNLRRLRDKVLKNEIARESSEKARSTVRLESAPVLSESRENHRSR
jgi:hypothetical protein